MPGRAISSRGMWMFSHIYPRDPLSVPRTELLVTSQAVPLQPFISVTIQRGLSQARDSAPVIWRLSSASSHISVTPSVPSS